VKNPNKYIRTAHITALAGIGASVWAKKVPKDTKPIPKKYVLITSQSKNTTAEDKDGFEWLCTIVIDIISILEPGYSKPEIVDDLEEQINEIVLAEIAIPGFINKEVRLIDSRDLDAETSSQSIERRVLTFQYWVNNVD